ncbi:hypothetical protein M0811_12524 [Anaeramoeba ignava]|uniref:T cell CD4 receptor C-terminal region domain-containing protein n=1 Tax=Anaeramoeba ignava TaxID=1746090 RepID=A0A9Q0R6F1_ANAIG|nr:hypothetical protein M0811_12524 [Anaeramoeba ignava]
MITFFYFLLIIGSVLSTSCSSYSKCTSCAETIECFWCPDSNLCYGEDDDIHCSGSISRKAHCPGEIEKVMGTIVGSVLGSLFLIGCCIFCYIRRERKKRKSKGYRKSNISIALKPLAKKPTTTNEEPTYKKLIDQEPNYQESNLELGYKEPTYELGYQEPNFQLNYQGPDNNYQPNYEGPIGMNFSDFSTYNPPQNQYQNN